MVTKRLWTALLGLALAVCISPLWLPMLARADATGFSFDGSRNLNVNCVAGCAGGVVQQPYNGTGGETRVNNSGVLGEMVDPGGTITPPHVDANGYTIADIQTAIPLDPTVPNKIQSGNCLRVIVGTAGGCTNGGATNGCTNSSGPVLPCTWQLSLTGTSVNLAGHRITEIRFVSDKGMPTLAVALWCYDNSAFSGTPVFLALQLTANEPWTPNAGRGEKIVTDLYCKLQAAPGTSTTAVLTGDEALEVDYI